MKKIELYRVHIDTGNILEVNEMVQQIILKAGRRISLSQQSWFLLTWENENKGRILMNIYIFVIY